MNRSKGETLRVGAVGCGSVANHVHIPVLLALEDTEIVAVCDIDKRVALETAKRFGIRKSYGDFSDMINGETLDLVDVCTPPRTHSHLSVHAMDAGLHVLVEKPMATSVCEADDMVAASKKNGVKLCVVHNHLFSPVVQKAKRLLDAGVIGELVDVETRILVNMGGGVSMQDHWYHDLPGGILGDYGPHAVYLELAFLGGINSIRAIAHESSDLPWVHADELKVLLKGENALGAFTINCNSSRSSYSMDIYGSKKILHLDIYPNDHIIQYGARGVGRWSLLLDNLMSSIRMHASVLAGTRSLLTMNSWGRILETHRFLIRRFSESIRNDKEPPVTGEAGRETVRILEEIWKQIGQPTGTQSRCVES